MFLLSIAVGIFARKLSTFYRMPDALFSAYCMGYLGSAIALNLNFRRPRKYLIPGICLGASYGIVQILYGLNPFWVSHHLPRPTAWLVSEVVKSNPLLSLDSYLIVMTWPMKAGIFFSALYLVLRAIQVISPEKTLRAIIRGNIEYLSKDGIVKSIGESLDADEVRVHLVIPGRDNPRTALIRWERHLQESETNTSIVSRHFIMGKDDVQQTRPDLKKLASERTAEGQVLRTGEPVRRPERDQTMTSILKRDSNPDTLIAVPIIFHNSVVGCLTVTWRVKNFFNTTAIYYLREWADWISPVAQSYREMAGSISSAIASTGGIYELTP